jgi:hypothetical protein
MNLPKDSQKSHGLNFFCMDCTRLKLSPEGLEELELVSAYSREYPEWIVNRRMTGIYPEVMEQEFQPVDFSLL